MQSLMFEQWPLVLGIRQSPLVKSLDLELGSLRMPPALEWAEVHYLLGDCDKFLSVLQSTVDLIL